MQCFNSYTDSAFGYIKEFNLSQTLQTAACNLSNNVRKVLDFVLPVNPVTLRREFRFIPTFIENEIGKVYFNNLCPRSAVVEDEELRKKVKYVFKNLVKHCERQELNYQVRVAKSDKINAFCLPGGKVVITTAMIDKLKEEFKSAKYDDCYKKVYFEDKLAAVLGHEIVHAAAGHFVRKIEFKMLLAVAGFALKYFIHHFFFKKKPSGINEKEKSKHRVEINKPEKENINKTDRLFNATFDAGWGVGSFFFKQQNSRSHELEADKHSIKYMDQAGYNPWGAVWLQDMFCHTKDLEGNSLNFFSTHPTSEQRMKENFKTVQTLFSNH